jgi:hypothetical protein
MRDDSNFATPFRQRSPPVKFTARFHPLHAQIGYCPAAHRIFRTIQAQTSDKIVNNPRQLLARPPQPAQRLAMENPLKGRAIGAATEESASTRSISLLALDRIEAALTRIENAAPTCIAKGADLRRRHEDLKASISQSLSGLDALLAQRVQAEDA